MDVYEITMRLVEKLIDSGQLSINQFPDAKTFTDAVCEAYKQIFKAVNSPNS